MEKIIVACFSLFKFVCISILKLEKHQTMAYAAHTLWKSWVRGKKKQEIKIEEMATLFDDARQVHIS